MEDEDFDNKSPVGQLIQRVNKLCKKPQIDEQLSNASNAKHNVNNLNLCIHFRLWMYFKKK